MKIDISKQKYDVIVYSERSTVNMELKQYDIHHKGGISEWDEALPIGNGRLGALIYGEDPIKLSLDRVDLWDTRLAPATLEKGYNYENLKSLVKSGTDADWQELLRLFNDSYHDTAYPSKITAGRIELELENYSEPEFHLSLDNATACIRDGKGIIRMAGFASAAEFVGVIRVWGKYKFSIHIPEYISAIDTGGDREHRMCNPRTMGYPKAQIIREGEYTYYRQKTYTDFEYGIVILEKNCGECNELYFTIMTNKDGEDGLAAAKSDLRRCAAKGYDLLLAEHTKWWRLYWNKSQIDLGDKMIEAVYYRSWYLFGSCSRKGFYPMPLQGVWTADNDILPPWKGDYHHDTNTQLSYQSYLKANHLAEGESFLDYLWALRDNFKAYANSFFGVDGLLIPPISTIDGKPMGGWTQYSTSPTMSIWTAQSFDEYYLYTGDADFLRERAYPFFTEIGKAISGLLTEKEGRLYLPLSSSPEIHDNKREAYLQPNSNCDLALMRYLFDTLAKYAQTLEDYTAQSYWKNILSRLDDIAVDENNVILLAPGEGLHESHRHFSHLMCLYPLHLINYDTPKNRDIYESTLTEIEKYGTGMWIGFSYAMAAQIYAMAEKGNGAYQNLYTFAHGFVADNGFHLNGDFKNYGYSSFHYRPFTLEGSFGFCDALHEMLMQDHMGYIHLFPAIADEWRNRKISFNDLRSRGGALISAVRTSEGLSEVIIKSEKPLTLRLLNTFESDTVLAVSGDNKSVLKDRNKILTVNVIPEVPLILKPEF